MISDAEKAVLGTGSIENNSESISPEPNVKTETQPKKSTANGQPRSGKKRKNPARSTPKKFSKPASKAQLGSTVATDANTAKYPRHPIEKALRIPVR
jgi:hypothetical protein